MMDSNWSAYDESPTQKENQARLGETQEDAGIHIAGDGMGGKKGTDRNWLYGEADEKLPKLTGGRKAAPTSQRSSLWDM